MSLRLSMMPFSAASSRFATAATAMPLRLITANIPLEKNGSGSHLAKGRMNGTRPSVDEISPRRLSTSTAGAYEMGPVCHVSSVCNFAVCVDRGSECRKSSTYHQVQVVPLSHLFPY